MTITAKEVLKRARTTLHDADSIRWALPELFDWLSDAQREIALHKPNAVTKTVNIPLVIGTLQTHNYISLIRVIRNTNGLAITPTTRQTMDSAIPGWHQPGVLPRQKSVDHVIQDTMDPRTFYVVPGNDGEGSIEAVVSVLPNDLVLPANPTNIESYASVNLSVPDIYRTALVDYVLSRAYSKDASDPASGQRSQAHMALFGQSIGVKLQSEMMTRVGSTGETE